MKAWASWTFEWGARIRVLESIARRRRKRGLGTSDWDERPELPPDLVEVWELWNKLHRRRGGSGFGPLPIRTGDVMDRLALEGWPRSEWAEVDALIQVVEEAWWANRSKKGDKDD